MSRYDWERGTLKIPTAAWKPLRDKLAAAWNSRQTELLSAAKQVHPLVFAWKKTAPRGTFSVQKAFEALRNTASFRAAMQNLSDFEEGKIELSLVSKNDAGKLDWGKLRTPKLQDFPLVPASKATSFEAGYSGFIRLDAKAKELHWSVEENNHAVEEARASYMGTVLFRALSTVTWTRGSGGKFVGNDEYNRDDSEEDGGGNYVTATFGNQAASRPRPVRRLSPRTVGLR